MGTPPPTTNQETAYPNPVRILFRWQDRAVTTHWPSALGPLISFGSPMKQKHTRRWSAFLPPPDPHRCDKLAHREKENNCRPVKFKTRLQTLSAVRGQLKTHPQDFERWPATRNLAISLGCRAAPFPQLCRTVISCYKYCCRYHVICN